MAHKHTKRKKKRTVPFAHTTFPKGEIMVRQNWNSRQKENCACRTQKNACTWQELQNQLSVEFALHWKCLPGVGLPGTRLRTGCDICGHAEASPVQLFQELVAAARREALQSSSSCTCLSCAVDSSLDERPDAALRSTTSWFP